MPAQSPPEPAWAAYTVWGIVNAVNLLQAIGFWSRIQTGGTRINHLLGYLVILLAAPAALALSAFLRARASRLNLAGPIAFLGFVAFMLVVDYIHPVEFRSPARPEILVPFLLLFFGAILLMGLPMFQFNRRLWLVTVITSAALLISMSAAIGKGVG